MSTSPSPRGPIRASLLSAILCLSHSAGPSAHAQPAALPLDDFVTTDGIVYAITKTNQIVYFGGSFTSVGVRTGGAVPVSADLGQPLTPYPRIGGTVSAAIPDGQGGWFLGGSFTRAGSFPRTNLVRMRSDRTVDPSWQPSAVGGYVGSLVLSGDTLYLGGSFTNVNGEVRNRLAAVDAVSGALRPWNPDANGAVLSLLVHQDTIYAGGEFTTVSGQPRGYLAALNGTTGQPATWNPGPNSAVEALAVSSGRLFVGGSFATISGQSRSRVASFTLANGALDAWNPGVGTVTLVSPIVYALAVHQNTIFIAGNFSTLGASSRINIGAVDIDTGVVAAWDARADLGLSSGIPTTSVQGMELHNNALYVGGILRNIGGQNRGYAAALDLVNGDALPWNPEPNSPAAAFSGVGNTIYMGGVFSGLAGFARTNLAAFNPSTGEVTPWKPTANNNVLALLPVGDRMYVGGEFSTVNGTTRPNLAAVDLTTGALDPWNPSPNLFVIALARWNDRLYVGGGFTNISGVGRTNIAAFDLNTGGLTSWNPALNRGQVRVLTVSGDRLYAGGLISSVNGISRRRVVAFDLPGGNLSSWDPNLTSSGGNVETVVPVGDRVYIGGRFTEVAGQPRTNLFAVSASTGELLPWIAHTDNPVSSIAATTGYVMVAGDFGRVRGVVRNYLAALDANTGELLPWNPNPDFFLRKLLLDDNVLYAGGFFLRIAGQTTRGIAAFPMMATAPSIDAASVALGQGGQFEFEIVAPGASQATVWATTNLVDWQSIQSVPVSNGGAHVIDAGASGHPKRLYRISVP